MPDAQEEKREEDEDEVYSSHMDGTETMKEDMSTESMNDWHARVQSRRKSKQEALMNETKTMIQNGMREGDVALRFMEQYIALGEGSGAGRIPTSNNNVENGEVNHDPHNEYIQIWNNEDQQKLGKDQPHLHSNTMRIKANIMNVECDMLMQQVNCKCNQEEAAGGLYVTVTKRYPRAKVYNTRSMNTRPHHECPFPNTPLQDHVTQHYRRTLIQTEDLDITTQYRLDDQWIQEHLTKHYSKPEHYMRLPGTVTVHKNDNSAQNKAKFIANICGQNYPGQMRNEIECNNSQSGETPQMARLRWFRSALHQLADECTKGVRRLNEAGEWIKNHSGFDQRFEKIKTIAIPYGIGCTIAGGDQSFYDASPSTNLQSD